MVEVGSVTFNANPLSATKVKPPKRWPQPKTKEDLEEALDAFPKTIVMDGCTEMIDEIDEAVQRHANKKRCTTREKATEKDYNKMMEGCGETVRSGGTRMSLKELDEECRLYGAKAPNPDKYPSHIPLKSVGLSTGGHPMFSELLVKMSKLHAAKDHDYSNKDHLANFYVSEDFNVPAWKGCLIRLSDKFSRIKSIIKKGESKVTSESLEDTLLDLATYSLLVIILLKETEIGTQIEEEES